MSPTVPLASPTVPAVCSLQSAVSRHAMRRGRVKAHRGAPWGTRPLTCPSALLPFAAWLRRRGLSSSGPPLALARMRGSTRTTSYRVDDGHGQQSLDVLNVEQRPLAASCRAEPGRTTPD
ncbi:hypothetical protein BS50DRAFT_323710 [Corynespora cassiicola Philippines]|uniref:Uncharacterized protein n=1 Tax=Corynespora cassiicola Philippines TaxID=1448308 RepID=A0A2T2NTI7_CORCC|nr:hypothetical protein BS50DRAFT_323710 [Corynespora cassiicola Philippines]